MAIIPRDQMSAATVYSFPSITSKHRHSQVVTLTKQDTNHANVNVMNILMSVSVHTSTDINTGVPITVFA